MKRKNLSRKGAVHRYAAFVANIIKPSNISYEEMLSEFRLRGKVFLQNTDYELVDGYAAKNVRSSLTLPRTTLDDNERPLLGSLVICLRDAQYGLIFVVGCLDIVLSGERLEDRRVGENCYNKVVDGGGVLETTNKNKIVSAENIRLESNAKFDIRGDIEIGEGGHRIIAHEARGEDEEANSDLFWRARSLIEALRSAGEVTISAPPMIAPPVQPSGAPNAGVAVAGNANTRVDSVNTRVANLEATVQSLIDVFETFTNPSSDEGSNDNNNG